ncbi:hypothetical protein [Mucilaginibacter flavus]|uniref:hypothetical protein n=1 Tax=Mucilaginibacter flavus TaxID=931504 RepID=UPI0025B44586|nr:hypothetical protein [Mucilaginibacter flavus]MDN3582634.1 hypothetical protein [Mucilaginibacter flavus]
MNKLNKYIKSRLVIAFTSLLSSAMFSRSPFENNPQDCELVSVIKKRKNELSTSKYSPSLKF